MQINASDIERVAETTRWRTRDPEQIKPDTLNAHRARRAVSRVRFMNGDNC